MGTRARGSVVLWHGLEMAREPGVIVTQMKKSRKERVTDIPGLGNRNSPSILGVAKKSLVLGGDMGHEVTYNAAKRRTYMYGDRQMRKAASDPISATFLNGRLLNVLAPIIIEVAVT
jgi:hypothetical protein